MKKITFSSAFFISICFLLIKNSYSQGVGNHITVSLLNCSQPTDATVEFDIYIVSDGAAGSAIMPGGYYSVVGINYNTAILPSGSTLSKSYISGTSDIPLSSFTFPTGNFAAGYIYIRINFVGSTVLAVGQQYRLGRVRLTCSAPWVSYSNPNFTFQAVAAAGKPNTAFYTYINNYAVVFSISSSGDGGRNLSTSGSLILNGCNVSASTSVTHVFCHGGGNGSASVSVSGGTSPYSYLWTNGGTALTNGNLMAGTYTVTITDATSCTATTSVVITEPAGLNTSGNQTNIFCYGGNNGTASVTITGGASPYSYLWSNSQTMSSISGLIAGTYTATITDANNCAISTCLIVSEPSTLYASSSSVGVSCYGGNNGTASVTTTGGISPYIYQWSNSETASSITGLTIGTYTVTITDNNNCTVTTSATITQPAALSALLSGDTLIWSGDTISIASSASGGTEGYSYYWSGPNNFISTNQNINFSSDVSSGGVYTVTVTDHNGCTTTASENITVSIKNHVTFNLINCSQPTDNTVEFDIYLVSDGSPESEVIPGGYYSSVGINYNTAIMPSGSTLSKSYISGTSDISLSGFTFPTGPFPAGYIYIRINFTGTTILSVGQQYRLGRVRLTCSAKWVSNSNTNFTFQEVAEPGKPNTNLYTHIGNWAVVFSSTGDGDEGRNLNVSDSLVLNVCTVTASASVSSHITCNGGSNGSATINVSGGWSPYSYQWSNGATSTTLANLMAGTYAVTVTDDNGCTATAPVTITQPPQLVAGISSQINVFCHGGNNASVTVSAGGGSPSYSYAWSNGESTATINSLIADTYTVTVTDDNGCTAGTSCIITQPSTVIVTISSTNVNCYGGNNGTATANVTGGTSPYSYSWSSSTGSTATVTNLMQGTFTVTVTDDLGCVAMSSVTINGPVSFVRPR